MKVYRKDNSTNDSVFWTNYIIALIFNLFGIFGAGSIRYFDKTKNKLKWVGFWIGVLSSVLFYIGVGNVLNSEGIVLGVICLTLFVVSIILVINFKSKIFKMCGEDDTIFGVKLPSREEMLKEISDPDYQARYKIEYVIIRELASNIKDVDVKKMFYDKEAFETFLRQLYSNAPKTKAHLDDISITYPKDNIILIKLPSAMQTVLCNMIGIIENDSNARFIAFTNCATEWFDERSRGYFKFALNSVEEFSKFLISLDEGSYKEEK